MEEMDGEIELLRDDTSGTAKPKKVREKKLDSCVYYKSGNYLVIKTCVISMDTLVVYPLKFLSPL